jgi:anti-sigma factor RsiW
MNCQDARERFSALLDGELGLTEFTETEVHVRQCAECGTALEQLHRLRRPDEPGSRRPPMAYVDESSWRGAIAWLRRRRPGRITVLAGAAVILVALGIASSSVSGRSALDVALRAVASWATATSQPDAPSTAAVNPQRLRDGTTAAPPRVAQSVGSSGSSEAMPTPKAVTPSVSASAPALPPAPSTPRRSSTVSAEAPRPAPAPPVTTETKEAASDTRADVVVQLSVQNQRVAERDVTTLLSLLGGSTAGENRNATIMAVIPRSSYEDFTRGLSQLGSPQMETEQPSLPDPVHVAIRLAR